MTSVVFVHGTGVREASFATSVKLVHAALEGRDDLEIHPVYWGDAGAGKASKSVPGGVEGEEPSEAEYEIVLWGLLYEDPLYELRILKLRTEKVKVGLGELPPGEVLSETAAAYSPSAAVVEKLAAIDLAGHFDAARSDVLDSSVFADAMKTATEALEEYRGAIARAWIARAIQRREATDPAATVPPAPRRDELVELLVEELGGRELAFSDWAKSRVSSLVTGFVQKRRGVFSSAASPVAGDILLYQARGDAIRGRIRTAIEQAGPPVVVIAHSLGGIACVDLLMGASELGVQTLITVGSQAPLFHEIGALQSLEPGASLPDHFPKWLNIYDEKDFLSYLGEQIFPGRITDIEVDNGQPFPASHGAYWENDNVWLAIAPELH